MYGNPVPAHPLTPLGALEPNRIFVEVPLAQGMVTRSLYISDVMSEGGLVVDEPPVFPPQEKPMADALMPTSSCIAQENVGFGFGFAFDHAGPTTEPITSDVATATLARATAPLRMATTSLPPA
jgi:hypothetical protein